MKEGMTQHPKESRICKKGLIFDLDGTLVDTLADIATAINLTRGEFGQPPLPDGEITNQVGNGVDFLIRQTVPVEAERLAEARAGYDRFYAEHMLDRSTLHADVLDVLDHFKGRPMGVVTNKPISQTEKLLTGLSVRPYFSTVLGGDSLAEMKPHPLPLLHFMRKNGLEPEQVVMIGDGVNDVRAGKAAGILTVGVTFGVSTREQIAAEQPDFVIDQMGALRDIIS